MSRVRSTDERIGDGSMRLTRTVAHGYAKVLAYKDEYEVARLFSQPDFLQQVDRQFEGDCELRYHLAPPLLARRDPHSGLPVKREVGPWIKPLFTVLSKLRSLCGTWWDPFGRSEDRVLERTVISRFEAALEDVLKNNDRVNYEAAVELFDAFDGIRGYGHVKAANYEKAILTIDRLLSQIRDVIPVDRAA